MSWLAVGLWSLGVCGALWLLDRWLYRLKERPPDYSRRRTAGPVGNALLQVQSLVDPAAAHSLEVRESEEVDEGSCGDLPRPTSRG